MKARNEISEGVYKRTHPKDGRLARAHGLHKLQTKICPSSQVPPNQRCQKNLSVRAVFEQDFSTTHWCCISDLKHSTRTF